MTEFLLTRWSINRYTLFKSFLEKLLASWQLGELVTRRSAAAWQSVLDTARTQWIVLLSLWTGHPWGETDYYTNIRVMPVRGSGCSKSLGPGDRCASESGPGRWHRNEVKNDHNGPGQDRSTFQAGGKPPGGPVTQKTAQAGAGIVGRRRRPSESCGQAACPLWPWPASPRQ